MCEKGAVREKQTAPFFVWVDTTLIKIFRIFAKK